MPCVKRQAVQSPDITVNAGAHFARNEFQLSSEALMIRFTVFLLACLCLASCHTTQMGQSLGWKEPQRGDTTDAY
jgi:hypothetical protein